MKKCCALLLALVLCFTSMVSVSAEEQPPYRLYGQEVYSSSCPTFTDSTGTVFFQWNIRFDADGGRALSGLQFKLKWDPEILVCFKARCLEQSAIVNSEFELGRVTYALATAQNFRFEGQDIFALYFRFADGVEDGTKAYIEIDDTYNNIACYVDDTGRIQNINVQNGLLSVKGGYLVKGNPRGDADGDGLVAAMDASLILRYLVDLAEMDESALSRADVTYDNTVGADDAAKILRYLVELEDSL